MGDQEYEILETARVNRTRLIIWWRINDTVMIHFQFPQEYISKSYNPIEEKDKTEIRKRIRKRMKSLQITGA